ncbi:MAG: hypothetical protein ACXWDT_01410 [Solirubrobacterales bacterium]
MIDALKPEDTRDGLRTIGGLLLGIGALMIFTRKGGSIDAWGDFPLFLVLAIPAALLYGGGVMTVGDTGGLRPWQSVYSVFGLILVPFALFQFIELLGGTPGTSLNVFWVFGVTAALGFYAGSVAGIRFQLLLGAIAAIVAWSALWDKIIGLSDSIGTYRGLLGILAILLIIGGIALWRAAEDDDEGLFRFSELFTGAGIAAVLACGFGITSVTSLIPVPLPGLTAIETNNLWDVLLLLISIGLISVGSLIGTRGPVYVGAIGLFLFLLIVGLDLNDDTPDPTKLGIWPVILVIGGGALAALSLTSFTLGDRPKEWVRSLKGE